MPDILQVFPVSAAPEKIFEVFTSPSELDNWWPLSSKGNPEKNNEYTFYFGPEYDWRARVIDIIPNKSMTWQMTQATDEWMGTEIGFALDSKSEFTQVTFFHKGWREASEHFGITTFCWGQLLNGLKNYVEKGIIVPHHLRN